eukprot:c4889_g1_i1 orf=2-259(+)
MILVGNLRQHSKEFCFCWHLVRVVCTAVLWTARNKYAFQHKIDPPSRLEAEDCWAKIGNMLTGWTGKGKENARSIAGYWKKLQYI